nr:retrotransposon protein, putative, Ty3-gypsy subclass [Tanacetum cinerariifolium]
MRNSISLEIHFEKRDDSGIYFFDRVWIPSVGGIRKLIMDEAHTSRYSVYPGADKMYYDLRDLYWWPPEIPEWKWEKITMDLVKKLPKISSRQDAIWVVVDRLTKSAYFVPICEDYKSVGYKTKHEYSLPPQDRRSERAYYTDTGGYAALYGRKCRSPVIWTKIRESQLIGSDIVHETTENIVQIKERLKTARSRHKSYADKRRKPLKFKVRDRVLLKELSCIHDTFHVSNLKKCLAESDAKVPFEEIKIDENLSFVEEPIKIMERDVKKLKQRRTPLVKVS